ncbi:hypothetical protein D8S82_32875 [Mycobacterium hodleri]|uniref:Uncharacterized protein n=1 Tax=Mycolicibacterium hodleri TaxID=49897 RepID=A0A544VQP5_9MYCO|nr:hypothetical protein [Mycolicibacterium hodleri]TQR82299.1 hypothetical protein D8S82_32875 [Mycolicibacterium hodleri]
MADDAWEPRVVLHDQNDFGGTPWVPSSHVVEQARQLRSDPARRARLDDAIKREVQRRWAQFGGATDGRADR